MRKLFFLFAFTISFCTLANEPSSKIYHNLQKVHSLKRVLYIAAHPDDENTRALAYFSLGEKAETAYMSLTRGDGGQNLIGNELSADLGVLRTQELLAARNYDGAKQFFSRAVDFGYSKEADETFEKWGKANILSDVVLVIRQFKPDVIITRFPPDKRGGHGHHTASAMLAIEAYSKAADASYKPNQVKQFGTWQTAAVYWNSSIWWNKEIAKEAASNPKYLSLDIGGYNPLLGMSYNEIGTLARSQHKCQGFGAIIERGSRMEYFEHLVGEQFEFDFFEYNKQSWSSLINEKFNADFEKLLANFDFVNPANNVVALLNLRNELEKLPKSIFKLEKLERLNKVILDCTGLFIDLTATDYSSLSGKEIELDLNLTNRSDLEIKVNNDGTWEALPTNEKISIKMTISANKAVSNPYWLEEPFVNLFTVIDPADLGQPISKPSINKNIKLSISGSEIEHQVPVIYKWRDPSYGERQREVILTNDFAANFEENITILKPNESKVIKVKVHSFKDSLQDKITIQAPKGWTANPTSIDINIPLKHSETWHSFTLTPSTEAEKGMLLINNSKGNQLKSVTEVTYDHIPTQTIFRPTQLKCVPLDAKIVAGKIAYINGVKGGMPKSIEQLGFTVKEFEVSELAKVDLSEFRTVVLGIRIYNVYPELKNFDDKLFEYVKNGGNVVMQYNTASRWVRSESFGPFPFELSRDRVTDENAEVTFLDADHPLLNSPNKITKSDFEDWVQERGLYFATNWSDEYKPLLSWHDKGADPVKGGLIVAKFGKGQFIYTGISFFRELPNGVSGAFKLFANLLSYQP
ncbi:MAG: PIG-L family deacetylase [Crocinitomicaceae bacterium]